MHGDHALSVVGKGILESVCEKFVEDETDRNSPLLRKDMRLHMHLQRDRAKSDPRRAKIVAQGAEKLSHVHDGSMIGALQTLMHATEHMNPIRR